MKEFFEIHFLISNQKMKPKILIFVFEVGFKSKQIQQNYFFVFGFTIQ